MAEVVSGDAIEALARVSKEARKGIMRGVSKAAQFVAATAKRNVRAKLNTTGEANRNLGRSISMDLEDRNLRALVGPRRVVYAAIHEFGGTIRPVKGRYLTIPVGDLKGSPRKHAGLRFVRGRGDKGLYMVNDSGLQYVLVRSVTIPARPYLTPALVANEANIEQAIGDAVEALL